jgi:hypothetical protein
MGERQPDMEQHEPGLRTRADQGKGKDEARAERQDIVRADRIERIASFGPARRPNASRRTSAPRFAMTI